SLCVRVPLLPGKLSSQIELEHMITASPYNTVRPKTLMLATESTVAAIIILTSWKLGLIPNVSPVSGEIGSTVFIWTLTILCLCSMTLAVLSWRKRADDLLILGTDDLAR